MPKGKRNSDTISVEWKTTGTDAAFSGDPHTKVVQEAAARRNIDVEIIDERAFFLSHGGKSVLFSRHLPGLTSAAARYISNDKQSSKLFLERAGVKTPQGRVFPLRDVEEGLAYAKQIGFPVVVKPLSDSGGKGVTAEIKDSGQFKRAWELAQTSPKTQIIVEKHVYGRDYRMFVIDGRFVCATERIPVNITGDGASTVSDLIAMKNAERKLNPYVGSKAIKLTPEMRRNLKKRGYDESSVIPRGVNVRLLPVANIGTGGDSKDVTNEVHPGFAEVAVKAALAIPGSFFAGVDLLAPDISVSPDEQEYAVPEINSRADIAMHHFPVIGMRRDAAGVLLEAIFPGTAPIKDADMKKIQLTLHGNVIGVGMRKHMEKLATVNHLRGWVRNDGNVVRALLCGSDSAVDRVVQILQKRASTGVVVDGWGEDVPKGFSIIQ